MIFITTTIVLLSHSNGKEELISEKPPKLVSSATIGSSDPTIVPLTDVITNTTAVRVSHQLILLTCSSFINRLNL